MFVHWSKNYKSTAGDIFILCLPPTGFPNVEKGAAGAVYTFSWRQQI